MIKTLYQRYTKTSTRVRLCSARLEVSSGPRAQGDPTNNQRGRGSGPFLLWRGLDQSRNILVVSTALLVRVQCFSKDLDNDVEGPSTRHTVLSMITESYFDVEGVKLFYSPTRRNSLRLWSSLVWSLDHRRRLDERFLQKYILETINVDKSQNMNWRNFQMFFEACDIFIPVSIDWKLFEEILNRNQTR